jgi:DNA gyrase subunit A
MAFIDKCREILSDINLRMQIIKDEMIALRDAYPEPRRTEITQNAEEFNPEDFYADDEMVITISHLGYIKRTPLTDFRTQGRGGKGAKGSTTRDEDFLEHLFTASMHNTLLLFTKGGKCFWLKVYEIPEGSRTSKGRAIQNLLNISPDDPVLAYINVKTLNDEEYVKNTYIILCTKKGTVKKTSLEAYSRPRQNGINAVTVREGDQLLEAILTNGNHELMIAVRSGKAIRFPENIVRPMGRTATGVRGIRLASDEDEVIGMISVENEAEDVLVVSEKGYGKRSGISGYRVTNRGGKGVRTINVTDKTGALIAIKSVTDDCDLMIITASGLTIRLRVADLRVMGRVAQGVRLIKLKEDDAIASVATVPTDNEEEAETIENEPLDEDDIIKDDDIADEDIEDSEDEAEDTEE